MPNTPKFGCAYSTLQMLTNIENRLEELFEQIETMPQDKVEAAEKVGPGRRSYKHAYTTLLHISFVPISVNGNCRLCLTDKLE